MMRVVPFEPEHVEMFHNYGGQEIRVGSFRQEDIIELKTRGEAYTAFNGDRVIGCAGVIENTKFRATAWGLFQKTTHANFVYLHRKTKDFLNTTNYIRIEAFVDPGFYPAMRWIAMLGFKLERAYIPLFFPDGSGASAWALHK